MSLPTSAEQLINMSLGMIGFRERIGNIYEGTFHARVALELYSQTRDELLRDNTWDFSDRNKVMVLERQAPEGGYVPPLTWSPAYPPLPWLFQYQYPSDCLKVRAIRPQAIFVFDFDPQPVVWSITNDDGVTPNRKSIVCNVPDAILEYTGQVTDLTLWEPTAIQLFADTLARRLAPALRPEALKAAMADEAQTKAASEQEQG